MPFEFTHCIVKAVCMTNRVSRRQHKERSYRDRLCRKQDGRHAKGWGITRDVGEVAGVVLEVTE